MNCCPPNAEKYLDNTYENVGSLATLPSGLEYYGVGSTSDKPLLLIPDVWGYNSGRTRTVADVFALQGYYVIVPKLLTPGLEGGTDGDGLYPSFDFGADFPKFPPFMQQFDYESNLKSKIQDVIDYFKSLGGVKGQILGFCWGGWLIANIFASDQNEFFNSGAIGHPSITVEEGIYGRNTAALVEKIQKPLLLFPTKGDPEEYHPDGAFFSSLKDRFPTSASYPLLEENHGFWPRGDITNEATKDAINFATDKTFAFFAEHI